MTVLGEVVFNINNINVLHIILCGGRDIIRDDCNCNTWVEHSSLLQPKELRVGVDRAGDTVGEEILLCGSWDTEGTIRDDCMSYNYSSNTWVEHSSLLEPKELRVGLDRAGDTVGKDILLWGPGKKKCSPSEQNVLLREYYPPWAQFFM